MRCTPWPCSAYFYYSGTEIYLQDTEHEKSDDSQFLARPKVQSSDLHYWKDQDGNVDEEVCQYRAEEELGVVDRTCCSLDRLILEGLDRNAVKDCEEGSQHKPDNRCPGKHLDWDPDVGGTEHPPVKGENRKLGECEREGIE